ncbi:nitrate- and nitrite sensing domain-containing protein [Streptomyces sp. NPDC091377]|uniref:nitrate- and nitrite sensing domain-containing protein n=1 Tax=Streptomyces sp. NPDC091377 TaxID=3365995 RepID=UPI0038009B61
MQGRFKRDGSASAEPEPHGGTGPMAVGSSPQHAQNPGPAASADGGERPGRTTATPPTGVPAPPVKPSQGPTGPGPRIALRNWRISTRLVALLTLPVVAATTLGAVRIDQSMDDIKQLDNMKLLTDMTKQATELAAALQEERDKSAGPLAHGSKSSEITVKGFRDKTDRAVDNFVDASDQIDQSARKGDLQGVRDTLVGLVGELSSLGKIRNGAYEVEDNSTQTVEAYHRLITHLLDLSQDMAEATSNPEMIQRTRALASFSSAKEYASVQRAVLAAALPPNKTSFGNLSENDRLYAESALKSQESELSSFRSIYGTESAAELLTPIQEGNPIIEAADKYASRAFSSESGIRQVEKRSYQDWVDDSSTKIQQMRNIERRLLEDMEQKARTLRSDSEREAYISGALILLVLGVSLVGAFVVARSMIRSLRRLQETATKVAQDRLPELVKQLSESDPQDVDTSVESVGVHSRDEIGRVAAAFDDVHREAVRLAAEQALLRGNVNAMFTNLSRRSQGLIQRQLSLISELESREADPDQLASLFKLDHLATRMRRNGENLLVLAGEEPGRRWTRPVPLVDVLRAAASEVEQYERIELSSVPTTEVAGRVVNDLVHLLAELLENATSFSSPQTKVKVTGHALPDGRVLIEIHDTGIGLSPEDLAAINERLASPPTVDVSVSRRMGLFVVGRLSQRHGIRIQLRPSDSGGTTALVMLPVDVAQGGKKPQGKPGQPGVAAGGPAAAQAAAGVAAARRSGGGAVGAGAPTAGRLGTGQGPRAALPGDPGGRPGGPGAPGGPGGPGGPGAPRGPQGRPQPAGAGFGGQAPGAPQGLQAAGTGTPGQDLFGGGRGPALPQRGAAGGAGDTGHFGAPGDAQAPRGRQPQLPPRGGPRAELPGGTPQRTDWGGDTGQPPVDRASLDTPRGHDEPDSARTSHLPRIDDRQGPGSTTEIPRIDADGPRQPGQFSRPGGPQQPGDPARPGGPQETGRFAAPGADTPQDTGRFDPPGAEGRQQQGPFVRSDVFGAPGQDTGRAPAPQGYDPAATGQFTGPQGYDDGSTGQFPAPRGYDDGSTGQFPAPRGYDNGSTGQFPAPQGYDNGSTGQFPVPGRDETGRPGLPARPTGPSDRSPASGHPGRSGQPGQPGPFEQNNQTGQSNQTGQNGQNGQTGSFDRPQIPQRQVREPEALPPATGPGDGRTPLYDTLETNWFHGQRGEGGAEPTPPEPQAPAAPPQRPAATDPAPGSGWRSSPNDELVRRAERVRQPAAGGVTTSGLPRRVPRANLVPGTAQQQPQQSGPQVSRAPQDVRGRLTNLRRGIAQGRQAGSGQTGSFTSPTHQQER